MFDYACDRNSTEYHNESLYCISQSNCAETSKPFRQKNECNHSNCAASSHVNVRKAREIKEEENGFGLEESLQFYYSHPRTIRIKIECPGERKKYCECLSEAIKRSMLWATYPLNAFFMASTLLVIQMNWDMSWIIMIAYLKSWDWNISVMKSLGVWWFLTKEAFLNLCKCKKRRCKKWIQSVNTSYQ